VVLLLTLTTVHAAPFLGIEGAPEVDLGVALLWGVVVGWTFATVGAFGGILAAVGHLSILGLGGFASSVAETQPELSRQITDSIRVSNQWLVGFSAIVACLSYLRQGRLVAPLSISLGGGAVLGSFLTPLLTAGRLSLSSYLGFFGAFTLLVGAYLLWESRQRRRDERGRVELLQLGMRRVCFSFAGRSYSFQPVLPFTAGFCVGSLASLLGVGGGFLYVPFLTSVLRLPYFIVAGTSALAVLVGMAVSISTYMLVKKVTVDFTLLAAELAGVALGSVIGARTSARLGETHLRLLFALLAFYVGLRYLTMGFLGESLLPP